MESLCGPDFLGQISPVEKRIPWAMPAFILVSAHMVDYVPYDRFKIAQKTSILTAIFPKPSLSFHTTRLTIDVVVSLTGRCRASPMARRLVRHARRTW